MGEKKRESNLRDKNNCLFNQTTTFRLAIQMVQTNNLPHKRTNKTPQNPKQN